jgi:predicted ATP-grasp superfamily ATP-dependent carboligase
MSPSLGGRRVLVLDGHSDASVAATQSLGRAGARVAVASRTHDALAFRSRYAQTQFRQPARTIELAEWIDEIVQAHDFDLVVPSTEASLLAVRELDPESTTRRRAVVTSNRALDETLHKWATVQLAGELGVPVPRSHLISTSHDIPLEASFPCVVKPVRSKVVIDGEPVQKFVKIAFDEATRSLCLRELLVDSPVIEQEYIEGDIVGIEALYDRGEVRWVFAHERLRQLPATGGRSTYRRSIAPPPDALRHATTLLNALGWHGVAMVEFKRLHGLVTLMEINPRLWGSLPLAIAAGVDFPLGLAMLASGDPLPTQPPYRQDLYMRHIALEPLWLRERRHDAREGLPALVPKQRLAAEVWRALTGSERWDHFGLDDWRLGGYLVREAIRNSRR